MLEVTYGEKEISVISDYNPNFVRRARAMHGTWQRPAWKFGTAQTDAVRKALMDCYGDDGMVTKVKVHIDLDKCEHLSNREVNLYFADKCLIATRYDRDSDCKLPNDVFCIDGYFRGSGGSMKHPFVTWEDGTVVEMNIPKDLYEEYKDDPGMTLVDDTETKRSALEQEREKLMKRLDEINKELSNL